MKIKAATTRITFKCKDTSCPWRIHASPSACSTFFMIKSYVEEYTCQTVKSNKLASSSWIVDKLGNEIRKNLAIKVANFAKDLYGLTNLSNAKIYRVREKAL